jgi:glycosyltransferase involved in cell wall biosynthesis
VRILLAISETPPQHSGVARIAGNLSTCWREQGHEVDVLSVRDTGRISLGEVRLTGLLARWPSLRSRVDAADVVTVFGPAPTFSDALLALLALRRGKRSPVVYTHVFDIDFPVLAPACAAYNWLHRRLANAADRIVVPTQSYAVTFGEAARRGKLSVIPWGMDAPEFHNVDKAEQFTVLFVGQLRPYKGVSTLLEAARSVPQARIVIAGEGPQRAKLEHQAHEIAPNVSFAGRVSDEELAELYARAHVVVLPSVSRLEAFGIVLVEGMAAGCVPVASALPGVTDVVGDAGYTFRPGDAEALSRILAELSANDTDRRERSRRARARSKEYSWTRTADEHLRVYESLVNATSSAPVPFGLAARCAA